MWLPTQSETQKSGHPCKNKPSITASGIRIGRLPAETNKSVSNTVYVKIFMVKIFRVANFTQRKFPQEILDAMNIQRCYKQNTWLSTREGSVSWIPRLPGHMGRGTWRNTNLLERERKQSRQNEIC